VTALTAQPVLYKTPGDVLPITASFFAELTAGDVLTGTPSVVSSPAGLSLSVAARNSSTILIDIPGNKHYALANQAVQFAASGGVAGQTYSVLVTAVSVGGRTFDSRPITVVVSST
jgi:hypothetical protein